MKTENAKPNVSEMRKKVAYAIFREHCFGNDKARQRCEQQAMEMGIEDYRLGRSRDDIPKFLTYDLDKVLSIKWKQGWEWAEENRLPMLRGPSSNPYEAWGSLWTDLSAEKAKEKATQHSDYTISP